MGGMTNYQQRGPEDDRCSYPKCRDTSEIRFLSGATVLNPNYGIQLCDKHHHQFGVEMEAYYQLHPQLIRSVDSAESRDSQSEEESVEPKKNTTSIDLTGMWE